MSIIYGGAHSVLFIDSNGTKTDSWDNMHLIPASRLTVPIPQPSLNIIKVPGSNKIIDMTEYMSTSMTFESVSGTFEFYADLDQWSSWDECYVYFKNFFAGKVFSFILADNPTYKYTGRLSAQELKSGANWPMLSISYILTKTPEFNSGLIVIGKLNTDRLFVDWFKDHVKTNNGYVLKEYPMPWAKYTNFDAYADSDEDHPAFKRQLSIFNAQYSQTEGSWYFIDATINYEDGETPSLYSSGRIPKENSSSLSYYVEPDSSQKYFVISRNYLGFPVLRWVVYCRYTGDIKYQISF